MRLYLSRIVFCCVLFCALCAVQAEEVFLITPDNRYVFDVEVADTPDKAAKGLMYRRHLPSDNGMIFISDTDRVWHMWMKNTYISLDMIFFDRNGKIVKIISNTEPFSLDILSSDIPVAGVLEVNAATAKGLNIHTGDMLQSLRLNNLTQ